MIAFAVVVAIMAIGIVLVNAMLIIPAATAGMFVHRLGPIMAYGMAFALVASITGLHLSYYAGVAASPAIVLSASAIFAVAVLITSRRRPLEVRPARLEAAE